MTQSQALSILKTGASVFLTGEPGSGKTHVLNEYIEWLEGCRVSVAVTASTGIAATHIGGTTIHSWSWVGARDTLSQYDLDAITTKERVVKRIKKAQVLVIDEISMLDGRILDMVDTICRTIRMRGEAFGGMQVVFVGDFFQLPPIARNGDMARFAFESRAWESSKLLTCYLTEQFRQEDEMLLGLLSAMRKSEVEEEHYTLLSEQTEITFENIDPTKLFTHNKDVDALNNKKNASLPGQVHKFKMDGRGTKASVAQLTKNCLSPELLELKIDSMVMCTKNNFEVGYVNGTLGRVIDFDVDEGYPIIETSDGREIKIPPMTWGIEENGKKVAEISQVPLRLAWAITIHKSQGMSLDSAEIDLRNAFAYGQGYVALSRVRTLDGLKLLGINANALQVNPKIVAIDERFKTESDSAEDAFKEMEDTEIKKMHTDFINACGGSFPKEGEKRIKKSLQERAQRESTYAVTQEFLRKGLSSAAIAKERQMAESTVWGHIEKLVEDKLIGKNDVVSLIPDMSDWDNVYAELVAAMEECGAEKLKPIYEAVGEKYSYDIVRIGRVLFTLERQ